MTSFTRRALSGATLGLAFSRASSAQPAPRLFALIVGIDTYPFIEPLAGCVNDARAIETAVRPIAQRLTVLINEQATRAAFLGTWESMAAQARPGDTLLITFSGHGGQEPQRRPGNEADGKDETLIFHSFHPRRRPNNGERIIDDELGDRFSRTGTRGIRSIFIADSCHSGTLTRSIDGRVQALGSRTVGEQNIENDMLAGLDIPPAEASGQPNLLFIAGAQENQRVIELMIDGRPHGATSFVFAQAMVRAVTVGRFPSTDAFTREVVAAARGRAEGLFIPQAENRLPPEEPLITLAFTPVPPPPPAPPSALRLHVMPGDGPLAEGARGLPGVQLQPTRNGADVVLDPGRRELVSAFGDVLARELDPGALVGAMQKVAAIRLAQDRGLPAMEIGLVPRGAALAPGGANSRDERHRPGQEFDLVIRPPAGTGLLVVSMAADGSMRLLSRAADAAGMMGEYRLGVRVTPHPGAAHVLALAVRQDGPAVQAALAALDRSRAPRQVVQILLGAPGAVAWAQFGFYVE